MTNKFLKTIKKEELEALLLQFGSLSRVAAEVGCSRSTFSRSVKKKGWILKDLDALRSEKVRMIASQGPATVKTIAKETGYTEYQVSRLVKESNIDLASTRMPIGQKFGSWLVLEVHSKGTYIDCLCRCDCGKEKLVQRSNLRSGRSKSCASCSAKNRQKHD